MKRLFLLAAVITVTAIAALPALAVVDFNEGFDTAGASTSWVPYNSSTVTAVTSGTNGIAAKSGAGYGLITTTPVANPGTYTRLGGYSSTFGGGFTTSLDVYFDVASIGTPGYGWDLSAAASRQDGTHLRDFIFHAGAVDGQLRLGASNNSNNSATPPHGFLPGDYTVTQSGWYTLQWDFYDNAGDLAVDMSLLDGSGLLWNQTKSSQDKIATVVGGNRYMWFTFITPSQLAIDNVTMEANAAVPEPMSIMLGIMGLGSVAGFRKLRRK